MTISIVSGADGLSGAIQIGGTDAIPFNTQGIISGLSFRNKLINGSFGTNQRNVSGTVTLGAYVFGHDRFKAGAGGCTYTFATVNNVITLTITAGTLLQVIEGATLQSGTHILSWTGTAHGRVDTGAYGASGVLGTAIGGTNQTCEWGTGTLSFVQYERGSIATPFENRHIGLEFSLCQRYYQAGSLGSSAYGSSYIGLQVPIHPMRVSPTMTFYNLNGVVNQVSSNGTTYTISAGGISAWAQGITVDVVLNAAPPTWWRFNYTLTADL